MSLLHEPHHDGSPGYLSDEAPALGSSVTVRLRTAIHEPVPSPLRAVWVRTTFDAEPVYWPCTVERSDEHTTWWAGGLPVRNPVTHYRFLLVHADGSQRWLTASGVVEYDVPDSSDFTVTSHPPAPDWGRDGVVYQIFPDRFARSAAADERSTPAWAFAAGWDEEVIFEGSDPRTPLQFFGGDLDGVTEHLDHVAEVGGGAPVILYTTPVFPGESNHRYNASTFDRVDDLLGGDAAYERLSRAVHERGWRLLGDLTSNHTGDTHDWFRQALDGGPTRDWYCFVDHEHYETWMGHLTLPKLDHTSPALRAAMVDGPDSVVARWLRPPFDVDGWRIDVANMTGRLGSVDVNHDVARAVRRTAAAERPDPLVIGEHNHDAGGDIDGDGWHGTMNYSGFSWPVWSWLRDPASHARAFGRPAAVPRRSGPLVRRTLDDWRARYGWRATTQSWNILGSHDSARIRTLVGSPEVHRVAVGLQFTLPGVPMVFAGDEIGLEGVLGEDSRRPMPWDHPERWDRTTLATYSSLARLRAEHPALRRGGLRWAYVDDDTLLFVREHPAGDVLVCARRATGPAVVLQRSLLGEVEDASLLLATDDEAGSDSKLAVSDDTVTVPASDGPGCWIWRL
jgi:alpha-glucosidase